MLGSTPGDGFVRVADGTLRWGRYGAAGLLVRHIDRAAETTSFFVVLRSPRSHMGGTWAIPGGALAHEGESPVDAALREFREEIGFALSPSPERIAHIHEEDHGGWSYWTIIVDVEEQFALPTTTNWETADVRWVRQDQLGDLALLHLFRATLIQLGLMAE